MSTNASQFLVSLPRRGGGWCANKWLRNKYGANLRSILTHNSRFWLIVDFGHSRDLFPGVDTFPALCVLQRSSQLTRDYSFPFLATNDAERSTSLLNTLIQRKSVRIHSSSLQDNVWNLEDSAITQLHKRLSDCGKPLNSLLQSPLRRGVNTGFNDAFLIDLATKRHLETIQPECAEIIHPWASGYEVKRWTYRPSDTFLIFTRRGIDISRYPAIEEHLSRFKEQLTPKQTSSQVGLGRKPGPYKWYEIQDNTAYFAEFERPKVLVPTILYYSDFSFVEQTAYPSSKVNIIPTDDYALLAILNSPVMWWIMHRRFVGMKDNALSAEVNGLNLLPIPAFGDVERRSLEESVARLIEIGPDGDTNAIFENEFKISQIVNGLFQITNDELELMRLSQPPRDPLKVAQKKNSK